MQSSGNLYYFSWCSFLVSVSIVASCYADLTGGGVGPTAEVEKDANGDIEVENLPTDQEQF